MSLNGNNILGGASGQTTGYEIEKSVVLGDSAKFTRTPSSAGNRKTWTWSGWVKRGKLETNNLLFSSADSSVRQWFGFYNNNLWFDHTNGSYVQSDALYRDVGSWYHIVVAWDTTQSTDTNRIKIYVNGEQISLTVNAWPALNQDGEINNTSVFTLGNLSTYSGYYFDGYLAEMHFIDGTALDASSFGETNTDTNQWIPKQYSGSYGTNGFYLDFATRATDPIDASGNGNNWSSVNVVATDWKIDTPTNNFATLNPLAPPRASGSFTYSEGNLKVSMGGSGDADCPSTMGASSGKWYAEAYILTGDQSTNTPFVGLVSSEFLDNETIASSSNSCVYYYSGSKRVNGTVSSYGATYNAGDIVGIAFNADDNEVTFYKNNSTQGAISLTADEYVFSSGKSAGTPVLVWNFGQDSSFAGNKTSGAAGSDFYYTPPTGFKALSTANLSDPSIADPTAHFNTLLYTGDGTSSRSFTGVGFQPDLTWIKSRNTAGGGYTHNLYDVARPSGAWLVTSTTAAETSSAGFGLSSFDSDGFTLDGGGSLTNASSITYASWNWKAGGTAVSNTDGSITSSVSANTDAGFSIISYTGNGTNGATVGHGLSQKPDLVIYKARSQASHNWIVYSSPLGATKRLKLDLAEAESTSSSQFNDTEPTSSVVTLGTFNNINQSSETFIAYAFHSVDGYSKVGSYTGNGATDGVFVYTGFRPSLVIGKNYSDTSGYGWWMIDSTRANFNVAQKVLYPNGSNAEVDSYAIVDFVSNGFKFRIPSSNGNLDTYNASSDNYIYLAFAESPFKTSNAR